MGKKKTAATIQQEVPSIAAAAPPPAPNAMDDFLRAHMKWLLLGILLLTFVVHLRDAAVVYLNPDEALHYGLAHQPSAMAAYAASNTNAHPPLLVMSLYYWTHIAQTEWFLRLLPILCSVALVGFGYLWGAKIASPEFGITLAAMLAFMPPVWYLATEVRHYPLAMCFAAGALYFLERGISDRSWRWMLASAFSLWLAILSNYSVLWFTAGFGVYSLFRVWRAALPQSVVGTWAGGQVAALATYAFLYVTHISVISNTDMSKEAREGWLAALYCTSNTVTCIFNNTLDLFTYLFGNSTLGMLGGLVFLFGLVVLWVRHRSLLLLIGVHFVACWIGVAAGLYPYGGSRHSVIFAIPAATAVTATVISLSGGRPRVAVGMAMLIVCVWLVAADTDRQAHQLPTHARELASQSVAYLNERVPRGGMVFTDHQALLLLCYYANRDGNCNSDGGQHFWQNKMNGYRVVSSKKWSLGPDEFVDEMRLLKQEFHLERGAEIWVFDGGWGAPLSQGIAERFGGTVLPGLRDFGKNLTVFRIPN